MSRLDSLPPDQRAVVQLVLQQGRTYEDLSGLLRIPEEAVRYRAHSALEVLAGDVSGIGVDRGSISDYLLGQQGASQREGTREHLGDSKAARRWAEAVAAELGPLAPDGLPEVPGAEPEAPAEPSPVLTKDDHEAAADAAGDPDPTPRAASDADLDFGFDDDLDDYDDAPTQAAGAKAVAAEQDADPQPSARESRRAARASGGGSAGDRVKTSRVGGALIVLAVALALAAGIVYLLNRGDDDDGGSGTGSTPSTSTAPEPQPIASTTLRRGNKDVGIAPIFQFQKAQGQSPAGYPFTLAAQDLPDPGDKEAYAVWLVGEGAKATRIGFIQQQQGQEAGVVATAGLLPEDIGQYNRVVVSLEVSADARQPREVLAEGRLPKVSPDSPPLATPTPGADGGAAGGAAGGAPGGAAPSPTATP